MVKQRGVTIVSLVVTIILLIILAGVSISAIWGENGIITIAKQAKENVELAQIEEQTKLNELYSQMLIETDGSSQITINIQDLYNIIDSTVDEKLESKKIEIKLSMYPIGSIYISTESTNPSEFIGGTWESYGEGRTLVGQGTGVDNNSESIIFTANDIGGEYNHRLSVAEIPSHEHDTILSYTQSGLNNVWMRGNFAVSWSDFSPTFWPDGTVRGNGGSGIFGKARSEGGSQTHNNLQPYIVTYIWKRIS